MKIRAQLSRCPRLLVGILICLLAIPAQAFAHGDAGRLANGHSSKLLPVADTTESRPRQATDECTTVCYVDAINGNDANSGKTPSAATKTIGTAVARVAPGGDVIVASGFYPESAILIDKPLSIAGVSNLTTLVDGGGSDAFLVRSGGVQIQGLTIQNGSRALLLQQPGAPLDGVTLTDVRLNQHSAAAVDVAQNTTVKNLTIERSSLRQNMVGVSLNLSSTVDGLNILGTSILDGVTGLRQQNDGSTATLRDLHIADADISNNTAAALQLQELSAGLIEETTFSGNGTGIVLDKHFASSNQDAGNIVVRQNEFRDQRGPSIKVTIKQSGLVAPLEIRGNQFTQSADLFTTADAVVHLLLAAGSPHGQVTVEENEFTLSTGPESSVDAIFGLQLAGSVDGVKVLRNRFDGGNVGGSGNSPATSALYVQSADIEVGAPDTDTRIAVAENSITGFVNGISVYDPVTQVYGGLDSGVELFVTGNNITGNSGFGAASGSGEILTASSNWWGNSSGPGGVGPGTGDNVTDGIVYCPWLDQAAPDGAPISPSGGYATTSSDGHQTPYCTIEEALFASSGEGQTVLVQSGSWPAESFNRSYLDSPNVTVMAADPEAPVVNGLHLNGAQIAGLTLQQLTFTGSAPNTDKPYQIVLDAAGEVTGLEFVGNLFDGNAMNNRGAIYLDQPIDDTVISTNTFRNFGPTQDDVSSLITLRSERAAIGVGLSVRDNTIAGTEHDNALQLYRWGAVSVQNNTIQGGAVKISAPDVAYPAAVGTINIISNRLTVSGGLGLDLASIDASVAISKNIVTGADTCVSTAGVAALNLADNTLRECDTRGLLVGDTSVSTQAASIENNRFISSPLGVENVTPALQLDVCNNTFSAVAQSTLANPGPFVSCPTTIEKFNDTNLNGERDAGEPGLPGWIFIVTRDEESVFTGESGLDGTLQLPELAEADYEVCEILQPGWINTTDICQQMTVGPDQINRLRFGNVRSGTIVIEKLADPADGTAFDFETTIPGQEDGFTLYGIGNGSPALTDTLPITASGVITFENVPSGTFTVTEVSRDMWHLIDLTCIDPSEDSETVLEKATSVIRLDADETVMCTYLNASSSGIALVKETRPGGLVGPFVFEGDLRGSVSHGGRIQRMELPPGEYTVREKDLPLGFELIDITCDDDNSTGDLETRTATYVVEANEFVTCRFINGLTGIDVTPTVQVSEEGETGVYNIVLATQPKADVMIEILPDEQVTTEPTTIVITPGIWSESHFVTVSAVDDGDAESAPGTIHSGQIRHEVSSDDPYYNGIEIRDVVVAIIDNDFPGVIVEPTLLPIVEEGEPLTYTVRLASSPTEPVAVGIDPGPELRTAPLALVFTAENWQSPQTVLVLVDDSEFTTTRIVHAVGSNDSLYDGIDAATVTVTRATFEEGVYLPLIRRDGE